MKPLQPRIIGAALLLAAALIGVVLREDQARNAGREARLPMEAVDPRDLLTGHYVALQMIQVLDPLQPCPPGLENAKWIALTPSDRGERVSGGGRTRAEAQKLGPLVIRGGASCFAAGEGVGGRVMLDIGVRRFHIAQTQALAIEKALRERDAQPAYAVVSVGADGKARLKGVIVGGQRAELTWW